MWISTLQFRAKTCKTRELHFTLTQRLSYSPAQILGYLRDPMRLFGGRWIGEARLLPFSFLVSFLFTATLSAANIGTVVPVLGQVADLVHDANRNLVYLANPTRNQVDIYSVSTG